uniref:NADH dehydrogenase subunit 6 n=1 Tax=Asemonea sichuanensis TaxID=426804 RepID=UPI001FAF9BB3|nr:NADH dehydrogenase subunit 6 [Asemonea sichuanensis]ULX45820.1 NADH dehydrogenase subunit 6 [Asemonea sichuanensis]
MVLLSIMFLSSIQPIMMVSMMIMIVFMYSYMIYKVMGGYWFSYILLMVMLSGVMVIFTYMSSLYPNESFESYNLVYVFMFMIFYTGMLILFYNINHSYISIGVWSSWFSMFNLCLVIFLLSIMLIVVWMSYMGYGSVRI